MKKILSIAALVGASMYTTAQGHIRLVYNGSKPKFTRAVAKANEILNTPAFYERIREIASFDNSVLSGGQVCELIEKSNHEILIVGSPKPFATASRTTSGKIKLSIFRFSKHLPTAVNTLIHETVHAVDFLDGDGDDFTHSSNNNSSGAE